MLAKLRPPKQGLLVAQLYFDSTQKLKNAEAIIDGKYYPIDSGSDLMIQLPSGQYNLEGFLTDRRTYPVQKQFSIKSGITTNLGYIVLLNKKLFQRTMHSKVFDHARKGKYLVIYADNTVDTHDYFARNYPNKYNATEKNRNLELAQGNYLNSKQLRLLRRYIAISKYKSTRHKSRYLSGPLGTVAYITAGKGRKTSTTVVDLITTQDMSHCAANKYKMICLISNKEYVLLRKKKVKYGVIPIDATADSIFVNRRGRIYIVDQHFNVLMSRNNGKSWRALSKFKSQNGLRQPGRHHFAFLETNYNQFIYSTNQDSDSTIVLRKRSRDRYFDSYYVPQTVDHIKQLKLTRKGVLIFAGSTKQQNSRVYFKPYSSKNWKEQAFGIEACGEIGFKGRRKSIMFIKCANHTWASKNGGKYWSKSRNR